MTTPVKRMLMLAVEDQILAVLEHAVVPLTSAQVSKRVRSRGEKGTPVVDRQLDHLAKTGRVVRLQPERRQFWELAPAERDARAAVLAALAPLRDVRAWGHERREA